MTRSDALNALRRAGAVTYKGQRITQMRKRIDGWDQYVSAYWVAPEGNPDAGMRVTSRHTALALATRQASA